MSDQNTGGVHWSFWVIGVVALVWNVMGGVNFIMQMNPDMVSAYRASEQAIIEGRPLWATGGFAIGVFLGALGSLLLLLRKRLASQMFTLSLAGIFVTMIHTGQVAATKYSFSAMEIFAMMVMPLLVAAFLLWYAKRAEGKGWIG